MSKRRGAVANAFVAFPNRLWLGYKMEYWYWYCGPGFGSIEMFDPKTVGVCFFQSASRTFCLESAMMDFQLPVSLVNVDIGFDRKFGPENGGLAVGLFYISCLESIALKNKNPLARLRIAFKVWRFKIYVRLQERRSLF